MAVGDDFLPELFRGTKGLIYFCALRNSKSKLPPGEVAHIITRDLDKIEGFRDKWDRPEHECGIYFHAATLKVGADRRIKNNCRQFSALFSDTDDANHEMSRDMARALLEQAEYPPTLIVDSGHGLQPYWLLIKPCNDASRIEKARKAIQNITASDNVADAARVMRLVGSHNSKKGNGEWLTAEIVSQNPECRYRLEDLERWLERAPVIIPRKPEQQKPEAKPKHNSGARHFYDDVPDLAIVRDALRFIPNDDREIWRNVGMALNDAYGDAGREVWAEWSASSAKYDADDQDKNWRSFTPGGGITIATLFHLAQQQGWQNNHHAGEPTAARGAADEPPPAMSPEEYGTSNRDRSQSAEPQIDLAKTFTFIGDAPHAPPRELIDGLIPAEGVAVTGGQSTAGKTFVGIYKSICLATATPYFGRKIIERVGTVFVAAEGRPLLPNRFAAALMKLLIEAKLPITWPNMLPDFSCAAGIKLFVRQLKAIDECYRGDFGVRLGCVPIDTVAATFGMKDEDDNAEATKVCNVLRSIGDETGALMAPVHHYGKNPESGLRGASAWKGSADVIEGVLADIDPLTGRTSNRELVCTKARDGEQGPISPFDLEFIELGLKDDGEIYGSCCVVPKAGQSRLEKGPAPTKSQRTIMAAIDEALDSCGKVITPRAGMPQVRAVKVTDVRAEFDRRYVVPDSDPTKASAAKRMAFKRALDHLSPAKFGAGSCEGADWIWKTT